MVLLLLSGKGITDHSFMFGIYLCLKGNFVWKKTFLIMGFITLMVAQMNAQSMSLGPQLGYFKAQDADNWSSMIGGVLRLKLTPGLGAEASINYRQENYLNNAVTVRSSPVMVTGLIYLLPIAYGAVGFGWYNLTFDYNQNKLPLLKDETTRKVGWHLGGGLEWPISSNLTLSGDIRYIFLNYDFQAIPGSGDLKSNFTVITARFLFDL
jgi:opacity protein-like surface antigen